MSAGHLRYLLVAANVVMMLRITDEAATLVRTVTGRADRSPQAGLRIIVDPVNHSLSMGIAATPAPADAVVRRGAARVFMSPSAADRLDGRTLRAELSEERSLFFLDG
jgi:Fe-S cluster assembly iron-binding protein IscA